MLLERLSDAPEAATNLNVSRRTVLIRTAIFALLLLSVSGCEPFPRDPEGTYDRVVEGELRVGLVEGPPWVIRHGDMPAGLEGAWARRVAEELGARPEWVWGTTDELLHRLERRELDVLVGGFWKGSPSSRGAGATSPYLTVGTGEGKRHHVVLVPPGENRWLMWVENSLRADSLRMARELDAWEGTR